MLDIPVWTKNISLEFHDDNQILFSKEFKNNMQGSN